MPTRWSLLRTSLQRWAGSNNRTMGRNQTAFGGSALTFSGEHIAVRVSTGAVIQRFVRTSAERAVLRVLKFVGHRSRGSRPSVDHVPVSVVWCLTATRL